VALAFDVGQILAKSCFLLESDAFILPLAWSYLDNMHSTLKAAVIGRLGIPTVTSVAEALYPGQLPQQDLAIGLTVAKAKPALLYTERRLLDKTSDETKTLFPRLSGDCAKSYSILKACRLADPLFVREADLKTVSTMIDELICINYYNTKTGRTDLSSRSISHSPNKPLTESHWSTFGV